MHESTGGRAHCKLGIPAIAHADHLQPNVAIILHSTMHFPVGRDQWFTHRKPTGNSMLSDNIYKHKIQDNVLRKIASMHLLIPAHLPLDTAWNQ